MFLKIAFIKRYFLIFDKIPDYNIIKGMDIEQKTLKLLEFDEVAQKLAKHAKTNQGKELCLNIELLNGTYAIKHALSCTREAKNFLDNGADIPIEYLCDMEGLEKPSFFSEQELIDYAKTLRSARLVKNFLRESSLLNELASKLFTDKLLEDKIFDTFDSDNRIRKDIQ